MAARTAAASAAPNLEEALAQLAVAMQGLVGSQQQFMRSASDADPNIGTSLATPLLPSEVLEAQEIDNTVEDKHRNGLPAALRDLRPLMPHDYVPDPDDSDYDSTDHRHGIDYGHGHHESTQERADNLSTYHRTRGRNIRSLAGLLPADGYMNPSSSIIDQQRQWKAHPLTLKGTLNEGDVRKGEVIMSKFLTLSRWHNEYGKAFNAKQFTLNLSTTHGDDLSKYASYDAYITGSNKIFYLHEHFKSKVWAEVERTGFAEDSTHQIPYRPSSQLKLIHLTRMVNVTDVQYARFAMHNGASRHAELRPEVSAGALNADTNTFAPGSPNEAIDRSWGREAALLSNNPVQLKFRNNGFRRETVAPYGPDSSVIRLAPVNAQFVRSRVLSREEWDIYHRTIGGFARTYTEQQAVGREELDASTAIKQIDFALCDNCVWAVLYTVEALTSEDVKSKLKTLRGQFDMMFSFYDPSIHPAHHFIAGPLALNTKILQYGTVNDQLASKPLMDRLLTVLGLCFDSLQEGDRTPYNVAFHEFMVDYNNRDDVRVKPKPQHKDAWQSPEALLQFAIDVYGQHKPELLERKAHLNFRPAVFNEPVPASIQTNYTALDGDASSVFATSEAYGELVPYDKNAQLLATIHRRASGGSGKMSSGGSGKASWKNQLGYHGTAAGGGNPSTRQTAPDRFASKRLDDRRRESVFLEVQQARQDRQVFPFKRGEQPPVVQPARDPPRFQRSKSTPPPQHLNSPVAGRPSLTRNNAAAPNTMSDRHPHSSRTGAPDHQKMYFTAAQSGGPRDGPRQREYIPPRAYAVLKEQKELLEKTLSESSQLSQQHLVSVLRQMQAGTSAIMVTETDAMQQSSFEDDSYHGDYDDTAYDEPSHGAMKPSSSFSPEALHILQTLQTSGFEGSPADESDAINSLLDQLPLSNFMMVLEAVGNALQTRVGSLDHEVKSITMKVGGIVQETITSHWDSCASFCFESSLNHCVSNSFVELVKKIVTANGGCNSDGMAWRRFHIPITDEWIALGDECNIDLRQADVITFAMPTIVATQFPTPVSIVAAPVAKGLLIGTNIAASYHEQDSIVLHQQPNLAYSLHNQANGIPYVALIDDKIVQERKLRMISHVDLTPYTDEKAMKILSNQWKFHDPTGVYWPVVLECYTLLIIGSVPRNIDCPTDSERGGMRFDGRQFIIERRLLALMSLDGRASPRRTQRVAQIVNSSHKKAVDNSRVDQAAPSANPQRCINRSYDAGTVVDVDQTSSAINNDSHSRQLSSDASDVDSTSTWRSNVHERNEHSYLSEARVLNSTSSLKTVDSLSCTGANESSDGFDPTMLRSFRTTSSRELSHEHAASTSVSVTEQSSQAQGKRTETYSGSFNDSVIDLASNTRKLPPTLLHSRNGANRSKYDINLSDLPSMNSIAHEMSFVRHSSMGEYPRAISPPVVLHPVVVSPPDVAPLRRLVSQTTYHFSDDSVADADSIADESSHTPMPPPAPHNYEVRQIQTRVWKANVVADTAEEAKKKAWSSTRGWTSESDDVVLEAAIERRKRSAHPQVHPQVEQASLGPTPFGH